MSLRTGLLATGIAISAMGGAATGAAGLAGSSPSYPTETLVYASLTPVPSGTHTVKEGENDWTISKKYGISVEALHDANPGTDWRRLQIGDKLTIPGAGKTASRSSGGGKHTVLKGENDNTIAKKYGISVESLHKANPGTDWRRLQIGQKLNLPGGTKAKGTTASIRAITTTKVKIDTGVANVRSEPTTNSKIKTSVDRGTTATVLDRKGDWYELRFSKGTVGWVRGDLLEPVAERASGSSKTKSTAVAEAAPSNPDKAAAIISSAKAMLGVRYKWGGTSRGGVDCSGLTTYVFSRNGIKLPRTSIEQSKIGKRVSKNDLQPGDLLFFVTGRSSSRINHVGIYIGDGKFIHSSSYRHRVVITALKDYSDAYAGARRVSALQQKAEEPPAAPKPEEPEVDVDALFPSRIVYGADKTGK